MKINQFHFSPWRTVQILFSIAVLGFLIPKIPVSQLGFSNIQTNTNSTSKAHPDAYSLEFNLPGTTDRKQLIQREIELYQSKLQQDPKSGIILTALANAYWKQGKATGEVSWYLLAEQTAMRSIAELPFENSGAKLILAQVAQARHEFKQARSIALEVLKVSPRSDEARSILATCALATGSLLEAETQIKVLVNQAPNLTNLTKQALLEEAQGKPTTIETFRLAIQTEEAGEIGESALVRVLLGRHFADRGDFDRAESLYQESLKILPRYPLALLYLAALQIRRGQYSEADRTYDQVIVYSQQATNIYDHTVLRGKAKIRQLRQEPYQDFLQEAEKILRKDTNAGHENGGFGHQRELAQLLLDRNQNQDAVESLRLMQKEINLRKDAKTWSTLASAWMVNDRLPEAKTAIQSALKSGIQNPEIFIKAALIERKIGNTIQAKSYEEKARAIDSKIDLNKQLDFSF